MINRRMIDKLAREMAAFTEVMNVLQARGIELDGELHESQGS